MKFLLLVFTITCALLQVNTQTKNSIMVGNVIISYTIRPTQTDFFLLSNLDTSIDVNNAWLAMALNSNDKMNGGVAVVCSNYNGNSSVEHYYLNGYVPQLIDANVPGTGLSNVQVSVDDGWLVCSFTRENSFNNYVSNIDTGYANVLVAFNSGTFGYHGQNKNATKDKFLIANPVGAVDPTTVPSPVPTSAQTSASTPAPTPVSTQASTPASTPASTRPVTNQPTDAPTQSTARPQIVHLYSSDLGYNVDWNNNADETTDFILESPVTTSNSWAAMGFSKDNSMGDDCVVVCKFYCSGTNCQAVIEHYYNNGRQPQYLVNGNPSIGITNIRVSKTSDKLVCSFTRMNSMANVPNYFDSTAQAYYLLNADGFADANGDIFYHSRRGSSSDPIMFTDSTFSTVSPIPTAFPTTKAPVIVKPIGEVIDQIHQFFTGFFNFLTRVITEQTTK